MTLILSDAVPWYTWDCVHWLEEWLQPWMAVWEWGSGSSTLFFAQRVAEVWSVEHDPACAEKLQGYLEEFGLAEKTHLLTVPPEGGWLPDFESRDDAYLNTHNFRNYAQAIQAHGVFDLVAVDGRARNACLHEGWPHVKKGGAILLDNVERQYYISGVHAIPAQWKRTVFWGHGPYHWPEWGTSVWINE